MELVLLSSQTERYKIVTTIRPFKFVIQVVLLEQDAEGNPIGEKISDPAQVYGIEGLKTFVDNISAQINGDGTLTEKTEKSEIVMPQ